MKPSEHTIPMQVSPTLAEIAAWALRLRQLHQHLAPLFARPEVHQHALLYLQAILSDIPRKNGWQIAEHAREPRPYGMQRLLSRAVWDQDGVRDALRRLVYQTLVPAGTCAQATSDPLFPVLVLDESGLPKRGHHSAGVAPQYCGSSGRVENCQVGVFASLVSALGHGLIDRELYVPEDWCCDLVRRRAAHIPDALTFATKPELAQRMVHRAQQAGLPFRWVVADTVYGHSPDLRAFLEAHDDAYALAVPSPEVVCVHTPTGPLLSSVADLAQRALRPKDWQRLSCGQGTKGPRFFDWARLPVLQGGTVDGRHWLVVRRCLGDPTELAYYLVWAPPDTSLPLMVLAIGARWHIEEDLQTNKDVGADQYEVRSYLGWYRHLTLVLLACAFLLSICVQDHAHPPRSAAAPACPAPPPPAGLFACPSLIPLTSSEVRHLLAHLLWPAPTSAPLLVQWSLFRRAHQSWAGHYHRRRREKAG